MQADRQSKAGPLFITAMVAVTLVGPLATHIFIPALSVIQHAFAMSTATAQSMLSIALLSMAVATLFYGPLSDRYGRRPVLLVGLVLFIVGTAGCALATDVATLTAGRFVQAAGAACGLVLARAMVRDVFGDDRLVKMLSYLTMAYVVAPMLAPAVGGTLIDSFGWRALFYFGLAAGVAILLLAIVATYETAPHAGNTGARINILAGYSRLLRSPRFMGYALHSGMISGSFFAFISAASFLMTEVLGRPTAEFGLWFMSLTASYLTGTFMATRFGGRISIDTAVMIGSGVGLAAALGFVIWETIAPMTPLMLFLPCAVASLGQGFSMPNAQSGAISVDVELTGTASGAVMFAHLFLGAAGSQIMGFLLDDTAAPMAMVYLVLVVLSCVAGIVAMLNRNSPVVAGS